MKKAARGRTPKASAAKDGTPRLLSGGNPQIAKADGEAPVQAYIAAMPGWKREVGRRLDAAITAAVPGVQKAVKWNSPFYGMAGEGWFLSFHCFARTVKVAFFRGTALRPLPPGESRHREVRYLDIHEDDVLDEAQFADWVRQASRLGGVTMGGGAMKKPSGTKTEKSEAGAGDASRLVDGAIRDLGGWRGEVLARIRRIIKAADPEVVEEWKWGIPVWSHDGIICTGETYKAAVKTTFARGASLPDPAKLFNSSLEGKVRRAIDFREGETINEKAFAALVRAAVKLNVKTKGGASRK
jgi:hypothetical protein